MSRLPEGVCCADGPHCEHQVPGMDEMREQYERRQPLHELGRRTFNDTEWADHEVLDMLDTAVAAVLDAVDRDARGPVWLPAALASVNDVARVCEAAGLTGEGLYVTSGVQRAWSDNSVRVQLTLIGEDGPPFRCSVRRGSDKPAQRFATIDVRCHPPSSLLWQVIRTARSTS